MHPWKMYAVEVFPHSILRLKTFTHIQNPNQIWIKYRVLKYHYLRKPGRKDHSYWMLTLTILSFYWKWTLSLISKLSILDCFNRIKEEELVDIMAVFAVVIQLRRIIMAGKWGILLRAFLNRKRNETILIF